MLIMDLSQCREAHNDLNLGAEFVASYGRSQGSDVEVAISTGDLASDSRRAQGEGSVWFSIFYDWAWPHLSNLLPLLPRSAVIGGPFVRYLKLLDPALALRHVLVDGFGELLFNTDFNLNARTLDLSPATLRHYSRFPELFVSYPFSYGCYWGRCSFCDSRAHNKRVHYVDPALAFEHITHVARSFQGQRVKVRMTGECMTAARMMLLAERFADHGLAWHSYLRADPQFNQLEVVRAMADSGCEQVHIGAEIFSDRGYRLMGKGYDVETVVGLIEKLHGVGIKVRVSLLTHIPLSTREVMAESAMVARKIGPMVSHAGVNPVQVYKTAPYYQRLGEFGLRVVADHGYYVEVEPLHMPADEFESIQRWYVGELAEAFGDSIEVLRMKGE